MIRIVIADDQLLFRTMLKEMLIKDPEIEIVALSANGEEAISDCIRFVPDIALLDIGMPGKDGIEALTEIKKALPATKVIILTTFEDSQNIHDAILLGANGYLIKEMTPGDLIMAVKSIYNNMIVFHKSVYNVMQSVVFDSKNKKSQKHEIGNIIFDSTDISIIKLIGKGKANKEIAQSLNYSEGTIKNKISKILSMTGLSDRTEITVFAINNDII